MSTPKKYRASNVLLRLAQAAVFITVEVLAALTLTGWLSVALWVIAAWNVAVVVLVLTGLSVAATEHLKHMEDQS